MVIVRLEDLWAKMIQQEIDQSITPKWSLAVGFPLPEFNCSTEID